MEKTLWLQISYPELNLDNETFETEPKNMAKVYTIIRSKKDLEVRLKDISTKQASDEKLNTIKEKTNTESRIN